MAPAATANILPCRYALTALMVVEDLAAVEGFALDLDRP